MTTKAGELLLLTTGEYSDYSVLELVQVLKEFDPELVLKEYLEKYPEQTVGYRAKFHQFVLFLCEQELVEPAPCREWYLGYYGCFEPHGFTELTREAW